MRKILGFSIKFLSVILFIVTFILIKSALHLQDALGNDALFVYFLAVLSSFLATWFWKIGKKLLILSVEDKLNEDSRPPILYLRSFIHDKEASKTPQDNTWTNLLPNSLPQNLLSEEEQLEWLFSNYGPFIAIGKPGEILPQLGASRIYTFDSEWKPIVLKYIHQAKLIILRVGNTNGFWWEVEKVLEHSIQNIVFLLPIKEDDYLEFKNKIGHLLPKPLPNKYNPRKQSEQSFGGVLYFDLEGTPKIKLTKNRHNKVSNNISYELKSDLSEVLERLRNMEEVIIAPKYLRLYAAMIDITFFFTIIISGHFTIRYLIDNGTISNDNSVYVLLFPVMFFYFYYGFLESVFHITTLGKKIFNLEIRHNSGLRISFVPGILRAIMVMFQLFSMIWLASLILILNDQKSVHDLVCKTNVFLVKKNNF